MTAWGDAFIRRAAISSPWAATMGSIAMADRVLERSTRTVTRNYCSWPQGQHNAYTYLHDLRGIHPKSLRMPFSARCPPVRCCATLPTCDSTEAYRQPHAAARPETRPAHQATRPSRKAAPRTCRRRNRSSWSASRTKRAGWSSAIPMPPTPCCLRLRQPYSQKFVSFKPGIAGCLAVNSSRPSQPGQSSPQ